MGGRVDERLDLPAGLPASLPVKTVSISHCTPSCLTCGICPPCLPPCPACRWWRTSLLMASLPPSLPRLTTTCTQSSRWAGGRCCWQGGWPAVGQPEWRLLLWLAVAPCCRAPRLALTCICISPPPTQLYFCPLSHQTTPPTHPPAHAPFCLPCLPACHLSPSLPSLAAALPDALPLPSPLAAGVPAGCSPRGVHHRAAGRQGELRGACAVRALCCAVPAVVVVVCCAVP